MTFEFEEAVAAAEKLGLVWQKEPVKLTPSPKNPTAGRAFTLRLVAARSDTGAVVQNGKVACVGRIGNARLKAQVQGVVAGAATCTWNLPIPAKGKTFRGSVAVVFEGLKAAQSFSGKVR